MRNKIFWLVVHVVMALGSLVCAMFTPSAISEVLYVVAAMLWSAVVGVDITNLFHKD